MNRLLDRLRALAADPGDTARAELAGYLKDLEPFPGRHWTQFPAGSVVALVLWGAGRQADALEVALAALRRDGPDDAAIQVLNNARDQFLNAAVEPLLVKRLDVARIRAQQVIDQFGDVSPLIEERALVDIVSYAENVPHERSRPPAYEGRPTVIDIAAWGERFIASAANTTLPCCLAPGNVPRLRQDGTVFIHIHTRAQDVERFRNLEAIRELSRHARIELTAIPESLFIPSHMWGQAVWSRYVLGALQYDSLMFARSMGADVLSLTSELLMSANCLSAAKQLLMSGRVLVSAAAIRGSREGILQRVDALGCRRGSSLDISAELLYRLSLEHPHASVREMFVRKSPSRIPAAPHQFHFPADDGFSTHGFQLHPFAFSTRSVPADIGCDFHTIDGRFPSDLLAGQDPAVWYVHDQPPGDMYFIGLDTDSGITAFTPFEVSPRGIANAALYWVGTMADIDHFISTVQRPVRYRAPPGVQLDVPADCRDETEVIAELVRDLEALRPAASKRISRYRR